MVKLDPFLAEHLVPKGDRASVFTAPRDALATTYMSTAPGWHPSMMALMRGFVGDRLASKLNVFHKVTPAGGVGEPQLRRGAVRPIELAVEQRGGHKSVTRVAGLEMFGIDPERFAREMQKKLACSATGARPATHPPHAPAPSHGPAGLCGPVVPLPGKQAAGLEVQVQGSVVAELAAHLTGPCGVPRKYVAAKGK
jgi:translation initiation factor 2D